MVAHVITAEVLAELEGVLSSGPCQIINDLVLGDVTALWKRSLEVETGEWIRTGTRNTEWESTGHQCRVLLKLCHVMASGCREGIRYVRAKNVGLLQLVVKLRLA